MSDIHRKSKNTETTRPIVEELKVANQHSNRVARRNLTELQYVSVESGTVVTPEITVTSLPDVTSSIEVAGTDGPVISTDADAAGSKTTTNSSPAKTSETKTNIRELIPANRDVESKAKPVAGRSQLSTTAAPSVVQSSALTPMSNDNNSDIPRTASPANAKNRPEPKQAKPKPANQIKDSTKIDTSNAKVEVQSNKNSTPQKRDSTVVEKTKANVTVQPNKYSKQEAKVDPKSAKQSSDSKTVAKTPDSPKAEKKTAPTAKPVNSKSTAHAKLKEAWWYSVSDSKKDAQVDELSDRIIRQFPATAPATMLFTSAEEDLSTNLTTAKIAKSLSIQADCKVLMVDGNWVKNMDLMRKSKQRADGLAELLNGDAELMETVIPTEHGQLYVLPCGTVETPYRKLRPPIMMGLLNEMQQEFQYVCVNGGYVGQLLTRRLSLCCDGTYLMLGLAKTSKMAAEKAIRTLGENNARLIGSIVFDSPASA